MAILGRWRIRRAFGAGVALLALLGRRRDTRNSMGRPWEHDCDQARDMVRCRRRTVQAGRRAIVAHVSRLVRTVGGSSVASHPPVGPSRGVHRIVQCGESKPSPVRQPPQTLVSQPADTAGSARAVEQQLKPLPDRPRPDYYKRRRPRSVESWPGPRGREWGCAAVASS